MFKMVTLQDRAKDLMQETFDMFEEQIENDPSPGYALARAVSMRLAYHQEYINYFEKRLKDAKNK
jgi:hypothetical protein